MLLRKFFRTAWSYKAQVLSMVIMIMLGVGVFLGFNMEWYTIEQDTSRFFADTLYADYRIYSETGFTPEELEKIRAIPGVEAATRFLSVNLDLADDSGRSLALDVSENFTVSGFVSTSGAAYDEESSGIWLSDKFAEANGIALGDTLRLRYHGAEISGEVVGLIKSGEHMICLADANQVMPDYCTFGFAYISPKKLVSALGFAFYPQINIRSSLTKEEMEEAAGDALGYTAMVVSKEEHAVYKEAQGEATEGKTMGSVLPVLFLAIAILTMVTTMHRIAVNEKLQIGTLKALGFHNGRILRHYAAYGFGIGLLGTALGVALGYWLCSLVMSENGMMGTYFDMPDWRLWMPSFCPPLLAAIVALLTAVSWLSVREQLRGTAAEALRPYQPKKMKKSFFERGRGWEQRRFAVKWNLRDIMRHKSRSAMTLLGVTGCMILLVGGLGMRDTMAGFLDMLDNDVSNYVTKVNLVDGVDADAGIALSDELEGDWVYQSGISLDGDTVVLEVYDNSRDRIRILDEKSKPIRMEDGGVYLCLRLKDRAAIGETITFSPYGSEEKYTAKVLGYHRSVMTESVAMTKACADSLGLPYGVSAVYTERSAREIGSDARISGTQDQQQLMDSFRSFTSIMDSMVLILVLAAIVLGVVVLYNLGVLSYIERSRELATLKVLGFRDRKLGHLLISQNVWLSVLGVVIGLPAGVGVLQWLLMALAGEYELKLMLGPTTYCVSVLLTFGVSLAVGLLVARKSRRIDMVEALKGAE
ncbi:MAG: FtsX-like permease family protein [Oscillospiraceae bacterium]|nr:FtsX-like permease family protein [Oscillospiraceae bacterium]